MRRSHLLTLIPVLLIISSLFFGIVTIAEEISDIQVAAILTLTVDSGSQLTAQTQMVVNRITVFDTTYDRNQIETSASADPIVLGAIMSRLHESMKSQLVRVFPKADVRAVTKIPSYDKPYFLDTFRVTLTSGFFNVNASMNLTNILNGVLDMGAGIQYTFPLQADAGWNNTYTILLPTTMALDKANTPDVSLNNQELTWVLRNGGGTTPSKNAELSIHLKNPTTRPITSENIALEFEVDTRSASKVLLTTSVVMNAVDIQEYHSMPEFITGLNVIPADGIRLLIDNGFFSWDQFYQTTIQPIEQKTIQLLENSSLNQSVLFSFAWDAETSTNCSTPYNITHMDTIPPVTATLRDTDIFLRLYGMSARAFFGLINAGAQATLSPRDINFGDRLSSIGYPYFAYLQLPTNITLAGTNRYQWNSTIPLSGAFHSDLQPSPPYIDQKIETRIELDLTKMDLNIPSLFTGKTELTATARMTEDDTMYVLRWPAEITRSPRINLTYLNSDAFRLCVDESVFSEADVNKFLIDTKTVFEMHLSALLHGFPVKGIIDRKTFLNSLSWNGDISNMDGIIPVIASVYASESIPVGFNFSLVPPRVSIADQQFTLQGLQNQSVTYRIIFPKGIAVSAQGSSERSIVHGNTTDGREYIEILFDTSASGESTVLTCTLTPSALYILGMFLPCIFVFILIIILVVAIYLVRRKRRERGGGRRWKPLREEAEEEPPEEEFEGQEYYVPPPPPSSRKRKKLR